VKQASALTHERGHASPQIVIDSEHPGASPLVRFSASLV